MLANIHIPVIDYSSGYLLLSFTPCKKLNVEQQPFCSHKFLGQEFKEKTVREGLFCSTMSVFSDGKTRLAAWDFISWEVKQRGLENALLRWLFHSPGAWTELTHLKAGLSGGRWLENLCVLPAAWALHTTVASADWVFQRLRKKLQGFCGFRLKRHLLSLCHILLVISESLSPAWIWEESWVLLFGGGVSGSHCRRACGMGNTVIIFGKYSLPKCTLAGNREKFNLHLQLFQWLATNF